MADPKPGDIRAFRRYKHIADWALRCADLAEAVTLADSINAAETRSFEPNLVVVQRFEMGGWVEVLPAELDEARRRLP